MGTDNGQSQRFRMACFTAGRDSLLVLVARLDDGTDPAEVLRLMFRGFVIGSKHWAARVAEAGVTVARHDLGGGQELHVLVSGSYTLIEQVWRALKRIASDTIMDDPKCIRPGGLRHEVGTIKDGILTLDDGSGTEAVSDLAEAEVGRLTQWIPQPT